MKGSSNASRLQYVTSNFFRLQGLRQVALGVMLLLAIGAMKLPSPWDEWLFVPLFLLLGIAWWAIGAYYEQRFGNVELKPTRTLWRPASKYGAVTFAWFAVVAVFFFRPKSLLGPEVLLGLALLLLYYAEHRRWYYLVFALPFFVLAILDRDHRHLGMMMASVWLLPLTLIIAGWLDHRFLVRSMPGVQPHVDA